MSRMSQLHAELSEQAYKLGFESLDQAIESGEYEVIGTENWAELVSTKDEQDKAYEAWLKEKVCALEGLEDLRKRIPCDRAETIDVLDRAIKFIKEAHD